MADGADRRLVGLDNITLILSHVHVVGKNHDGSQWCGLSLFGGDTVIGKQTKESVRCKTLCLMDTQRVCNGAITGLQLHPNVPLTPL